MFEALPASSRGQRSWHSVQSICRETQSALAAEGYRGAYQLEQALLKVVVVLARIAHELCDGALALAQLTQAEGAQLVQLPAQPWDPNKHLNLCLDAHLMPAEHAPDAAYGSSWVCL